MHAPKGAVMCKAFVTGLDRRDVVQSCALVVNVSDASQSEILRSYNYNHGNWACGNESC